MCWSLFGDEASPIPSGTFAAVSVGPSHACGLRADRAIACWALENGETAPVPDRPFAAVSVGLNHACGLRADTSTATCWLFGSHVAAPTGVHRADREPTRHEEPPTQQPLTTFSAVDAGWDHTCATRTDTTTTCWVHRREGQAAVSPEPGDLPADPSDDFRYSVLEIPTGLFVSVSDGGWHSCGVRTDGTIACWGENDWNQAAAPGGRFNSVAAGGWHTCALRTDATVDCWGLNDIGTPRDDFPYSRGVCWSPTTVAPEYCWSGAGEDPDGFFDAISAGAAHTCGLRTDGTIACWGHGAGGRVDVPNDKLSTQFLSENFLCWGATYSVGTLSCAVYGDVGQGDAPGGTFSAVTAGGWHTCALRADGTIACWGHNDHGQRNPPPGTFSAVSAGWAHTCALRADGTATCWGDNSHRQTDTPTGAFIAIAAGGTHTCGLRPDNTIICWGTPGFVRTPNGVQWN